MTDGDQGTDSPYPVRFGHQQALRGEEKAGLERQGDRVVTGDARGGQNRQVGREDDSVKRKKNGDPALGCETL